MDAKENKENLIEPPRNRKADIGSLMDFLNLLYEKYKNLKEGALPDYIPELAIANPDWFGISVVTFDGRVFEVGNCDQFFTIQSISKPFIYGLALEENGEDYMLSKVGVEPTGDAFNAIILDEKSKRPYNPMVNAGAIATTSLIKGANPTERLNKMLDMFRQFTGRDITFDVSVYMSEKTTGNRNRAISYLMLNFGMIDNNIEEILDLYFQQCSLLVNSHDLAVMAATLANGGINPITGRVAIERQYVKNILSVMFTCGMYDYSGEWGYNVGIPAKSGVSGGIIAVVPRQVGIGVFSPLLDDRGNSVRGIKVCEELSRRYGLNMFNVQVAGYGILENNGLLGGQNYASCLP